jgi:hypothetical protein
MTRDELIEKMARGIAVSQGHDPDKLCFSYSKSGDQHRPTWMRFVVYATAAIAAIEAAGAVVVPVEATERMVHAASAALDIWKENNGLAQRSLREGFIDLKEKHRIRYVVRWLMPRHHTMIDCRNRQDACQQASASPQPSRALIAKEG